MRDYFGKKVVIITSDFPPVSCGIGDYSDILAKYLNNKNFEVHVICKSKSEADKSLDLFPYIKSVSSVQNWNKDGIEKAIAKISAIKPDCVLLQYEPYMYSNYGVPVGLISFSKAVRRLNIKLLITFHETYIRFRIWPLKYWIVAIGQRYVTKALCHYSDYIVTSIDLYGRFLKRYTTKTIHLLPIPSNIAPIDVAGNEIENLKNIISPNGEQIVSTFGNRDHKLLIAVFKQLMVKHPKTKLLICGSVKDKDQYSEIKEHVFITGYLDQKAIHIYLRTSDVFFLPDGLDDKGRGGSSNKSGVLAAALAAGVPIAGIKGDMNNELLKKIPALFLWDTINNDEAVDQLISLLSSKKMPSPNSEFYKKNLSWEKITEEYCRILYN